MWTLLVWPILAQVGLWNMRCKHSWSTGFQAWVCLLSSPCLLSPQQTTPHPHSCSAAIKSFMQCLHPVRNPVWPRQLSVSMCEKSYKWKWDKLYEYKRSPSDCKLWERKKSFRCMYERILQISMREILQMRESFRWAVAIGLLQMGGNRNNWGRRAENHRGDWQHLQL